MSDWTLAGELKKRGMSITDACKLCKMDRPTMEILVGGGKTLPQLALKVAKAMHLTKEQAKTLGQPLKSPNWMKRDSGMGTPKRINIMEHWYNALDKDKPAEDEGKHRRWIDAAAVARWLWTSKQDLSVWYNNQGFKFGDVNQIRTDKVRHMRIAEAEEIMGLPPEVMETDRDMGNVVVQVRFQLNKGRIDRMTGGKKLDITTMIDRYMAVRGNVTNRKSAGNAVHDLMDKLELGKPVTSNVLKNICAVWQLPMYEVADLVVWQHTRVGGEADAE